MKIFNLPDLGEGLADAEIREWHVKVGDEIKVDEPMVCMETAKAVVEVPSPYAGKITKLFGAAGDVINTGDPLIEFAIEDKGSVVGNLEESNQSYTEDEVIVGAAKSATANVKAMPAVRMLAKQLNVDLNDVTPSGPQGQITAEDVKACASSGKKSATKKTSGKALHGVRRAMAMAMTQSHQEVVPVTIFEEADISELPKGSDITAKIIQALVAAVKAEPQLNAWYDGNSMEVRLFEEINVGLAMDSAEGLFVPVLKNVAEQSASKLRSLIDNFKKTVGNRTVTPSELQGATITLSNFGMLAGIHATPIIVPPMVAILGCGRIHHAVKAKEGVPAVRKILPLSLTFDHRAVTGGEATRFLAAVIHSLEK